MKILGFGAAVFSLLDREHCLRKQVFLTAPQSWEEDLGLWALSPQLCPRGRSSFSPWAAVPQGCKAHPWKQRPAGFGRKHPADLFSLRNVSYNESFHKLRRLYLQEVRLIWVTRSSSGMGGFFHQLCCLSPVGASCPVELSPGQQGYGFLGDRRANWKVRLKWCRLILEDACKDLSDLQACICCEYVLKLFWPFFNRGLL